MPSAQTDDREFDLILYGATGFVGKLLARYVASAAPAGTRIALVGRDAARVEAVRAELPDSAHSWGVVRATRPTRTACATWPNGRGWW